MPRHEHDCDCCTSLGEFHEFDLYHCNNQFEETVIARFGPDGDYHSGMCFADSMPELGEAKKRAAALGILGVPPLKIMRLG